MIMRRILHFASILFLVLGVATAQNVGVNKPTPQVPLHVAGAIALDSTQSLAAANAITITRQVSTVLITPTAGVQTNAITYSPATIPSGQLLYIYNNDGDAATFAGQSIAAGTMGSFIYLNSGWRPIGGGSSGWSLTGNSIAGTEVLGTLTAQPLKIVTGTGGPNERARVAATGEVLVNSTTIPSKLAVPQTFSANNRLTVTGAADDVAIFGTSSGNGSAGVYGENTNAATVAYGTVGVVQSSANNSAGVLGNATATSGTTRGVQGSAASTTDNAAGIMGFASGASGRTKAVWGQNSSTTDDAVGVYGTTIGATGATKGVWGQTTSDNANAAGVYGAAPNGTASGVWGISGSSVAGAKGVKGEATSTTAQVSGVYGTTGSRLGAGVVGSNSNTSLTDATASQAIGLQGQTTARGHYAVGVTGYAGGGGARNTYGVIGETNSTNTASGLASGVMGTSATGGWGVISLGDMGSSGLKPFIIDHPLDPANKMLKHFCIEAPEPFNIYNGNIVTDANGEAVVALPNYFEALNINPKYQLTVIGSFSQAIVKEEIRDNKFVVATNQPNVKVSWQVTATRNDAYVRWKSDKLIIEVEKSEDLKGRYFWPQAFGQPDSLRIGPSLNLFQDAGSETPQQVGEVDYATPGPVRTPTPAPTQGSQLELLKR